LAFSGNDTSAYGRPKNDAPRNNRRGNSVKGTLVLACPAEDRLNFPQRKVVCGSQQLPKQTVFMRARIAARVTALWPLALGWPLINGDRDVLAGRRSTR
jgi:hypothetical protein